MKGIDLTGQVYEKLTVVRFIENKNWRNYWLCKCDCGNETKLSTTRLRDGHTKSCGCLKGGGGKIKHGYSGRKKSSAEYRSWCSMKVRCYNINSKAYPRYGGRGIAVCDRWRNSFENFLADMGKKPSLSHTLDRIDNNSNYEPLNCKWATQKEQQNNKRSNIMVTIEGITKTLTQWCELLNISYPLAVDLVYRKKIKPADAIKMVYKKTG